MLTQTVLRSVPTHQEPRVASFTFRPVAGLIDQLGTARPFARNVEIYGENDPARYVYKIVSGAVRTYRILADGRRQIEAFHVAGDMFGLEFDDQHEFSAEAIVDSRILVVRRSAVIALAEHDNQIACQLWTLTARELQRTQSHLMLLIKTARERVVSFLLEMAERTPCGDVVDLPMSRQDIADYLGLTIETVSRTLNNLERLGAIALPSSRHIVLRDHEALLGGAEGAEDHGGNSKEMNGVNHARVHSQSRARTSVQPCRQMVA